MKNKLMIKFLAPFIIFLLLLFVVIYIFYKPLYKSRFLREKNLQALEAKTRTEGYVEELKNTILDEEFILKAIKSRSNVSAHGPDGISNFAWKVGGKITAKIIRMTTEVIILSKRCPELLKRAKTIMLYKKGDPSQTNAWRPITITPTLYRMWMVAIARGFQKINSIKRYISMSQKGFMCTSNGIAEHSIMMNEFIQHTVRNKGSIYITTIDFADAFGSAPHALIFKALKDIGFDKDIVEMIRQSYMDTHTKIQVPKGKSKTLLINNGVKQGCPFSPIIFNICIDALVRKLEDQTFDGFHVNGMNFSAQAYADDIVLLSDTEQGMTNLLKTIEKFCSYSKMKVNPNKCTTWSYINSNGKCGRADVEFKINNAKIPVIQLYDGTPYLGIISAIQKSYRGKISSVKLEKARDKIIRICASPLKFIQKCDAIKRLILPTLDFELANGYVNKKDRDYLNTSIRAAIDTCLKSTQLPIEFFYTAWKDGGLGIYDLNDRYENLILKSFVELWFSKDVRIRSTFRCFCNDERRIRSGNDVVQDPKYILRNLNSCKHKIHERGSSNLFGRIVKCFADRMEFTLKEETEDEIEAIQKIKINCMSLDSEQTNELRNIRLPRDISDNNGNVNELVVNGKEIYCRKDKLLKVLKAINDIQHRNGLINMRLRGHTFHTLKKCNISNYFMTQYKSTLPDDIVTFGILARTNSYMTGQISRLSNRNNDRSLGTDRCKRCGGNDSLRHRLNDCEKLKNKFKTRHDYVVKEITEMLKLVHGQSTLLNLDCMVRDKAGRGLTGENAHHKPDIWYYNSEDRMTMIETTVPYGDIDEDGTSSLDKRYRQKMEKYRSLVNDIKEQWNINVDYYVIVISSLGAWQNDSLKNLRTLATDRRTWIRFAKRITICTIRGSKIIMEGKNDGKEGNADLSGFSQNSDDSENDEIDVDEIQNGEHERGRTLSEGENMLLDDDVIFEETRTGEAQASRV